LRAPLYLLDTNVLSELTKPRPDETVSRRIYGVSPERLFASEVSRYELRRGAQMKNDPETIWERIEELILPIVTWLALDSDVAMAAADADAQLTRIGRRIDRPDLLLAATALAFDLVLVTRNVRHFTSVQGLTVENWFPERKAEP
jgi:predicted nucleic acid-binding protein